MKNERAARGTKMSEMEQKWFYDRFGVDERPTDNVINQTVKPEVLFDEGTMRRGWTYERFPGVRED